MNDLAEKLISEEEGKKPYVYKDTRKLFTIGIGCLVDPSVPGAGLCDEAISVQFAHDSAVARRSAAKFPRFAEMSEVRRAVLISMCFQMGEKPLHWPSFMYALEMGDYDLAKFHGLDSDWARTQTPERAKRQMEMLATGQWIDRA